MNWRLSDGESVRGRVWFRQGTGNGEQGTGNGEQGTGKRAPRATARAADETGAGEEAVLYLHGIQSHGGWYEWSASVLAQAGKLVVLPDRRGSGMNDAARGDTPSAEQWLADLDDIADAVERQYGVRRWAICGVSWGGKLALAWARRRPDRVSRLLLVAPGLFPAVGVGIVERLRIAGALLFSPSRRFAIPLSDAALFTDNPAGRDFIVSDGLKLTHATARFLWQSTRLGRMALRRPEEHITTPVALLLAERDRIIRNQPTEQWLRASCAGELEVKRFAGAAHTIEFEPDTTSYEQVLRAWALGVSTGANPQ